MLPEKQVHQLLVGLLVYFGCLMADGRGFMQGGKSYNFCLTGCSFCRRLGNGHLDTCRRSNLNSSYI